MQSDNKVTIAFVINGVTVSIETNTHPPLREAITRALSESGNTGRPSAEWQVRDANGVLLDPDRRISDFGFSSGTRLFLSLAVGAGGTRRG